MFVLKTKKEIGSYFAGLVEKSNFKSMRQFGKAYLELLGKSTGDTELQIMSDKLSKIKKGTGSITVEDLPVFTHLLNVTCEELLSAGEFVVPSADYMTVRQFAASDDSREWERFVQRKDRPFLNCDEFGKNAIEYALEFKNYALLKYLMEKGYIWFVGPDPDKYSRNFTAGTSIERRKPYELDNLTYDIQDVTKDSDRLRREMICLALEYKDLEMLTTLRAREIPTLYGMTIFSMDGAEVTTFRDEEMIRRIAAADDSVIDYFSREFTIQERYCSERTDTYIFPYIGSVAELLIKENHPCAEAVLKRCAEHNRKFLQQLEDAVDEIKQDYIRMHEAWNEKFSPTEEELYQYSVRSICFCGKNDNVISWSTRSGNGSITDLVLIGCDSESFRLAPLIDDINGSYNRVMELKAASDR